MLHPLEHQLRHADGVFSRSNCRGSRDDVLEPSVYDLARESARVEGGHLPVSLCTSEFSEMPCEGTREGAEEEKQEEQASKAY